MSPEPGRRRRAQAVWRKLQKERVQVAEIIDDGLQADLVVLNFLPDELG